MLDRAVEAVLGPLDWAWHAETDPAASGVLAAHYPDVLNLGDITAVEWTRVAPVDVLCGGYPCQGFSYAGLRLGEDDERFIWPHIFAAVRDLRPRGVLLENVPGHLSLGFGRVLGDLASIGYDAGWMCLRASDIGAPHRRNRVFIAAWPADTDRGGWRPNLDGVRAGKPDAPRGTDAVALLPTPTTSEGKGPGRLDGYRNDTLRAQIALLKTPTAQLAVNGGSQHPDKRKAGGHGPTLADQVEHLLPTPTTRNIRGNQNNNRGDLLLPGAVQPEHWGAYAPAIARWETVLGRRAPEPVEPNRKGTGVRLAAPFVEWVMGCDEGWVTSHVGRNDALRILGNGVVWQQAAYAYAQLLGGAR